MIAESGSDGLLRFHFHPPAGVASATQRDKPPRKINEKNRQCNLLNVQLDFFSPNDKGRNATGSMWRPVNAPPAFII